MNNSIIQYLSSPQNDTFSVGLSADELIPSTGETDENIEINCNITNPFDPRKWNICRHEFKNGKYHHSIISLKKSKKSKTKRQIKIFNIFDEIENGSYDIKDSLYRRLFFEFLNESSIDSNFYRNGEFSTIYSKELKAPYGNSKIQFVTNIARELTDDEIKILEKYDQKRQRQSDDETLRTEQRKKKRLKKWTPDKINEYINNFELHTIKVENDEKEEWYNSNGLFTSPEFKSQFLNDPDTPELTHDTLNGMLCFYNFNNIIIKINKWKTDVSNIVSPIRYNNGIAVNNNNIDNLFYFYFNDSKIFIKLDNEDINTNIAADYIFSISLALLWLNREVIKDLSIKFSDVIFYISLLIIEKIFISRKVHKSFKINKDKFISRLKTKIEEIKNESDLLNALKRVARVAGGKTCIYYPKGWTIDQKREWKENNGIERNDGIKQKERKDKGEKRVNYTMSSKRWRSAEERKGTKYKKSKEKQYDEEIRLMKILELKNEGLSLTKIANTLNIGRSTVQRALEKIEKERI